MVAMVVYFRCAGYQIKQIFGVMEKNTVGSNITKQERGPGFIWKRIL
jgi:hypothetical protein